MKTPAPEAPKAHPFIKWAGGKSQLVPTIREVLPPKIRTYHEPFLGGGALFFALAAEKRFERAVLNDWNRELVDTYRVVRDFPEELVDRLRKMEETYGEAPKTMYEAWRNPDPHLAELMSGPIHRAGRFIFLNKAGFNGLYRVNKQGVFNVPWGKKLKVRTFDEANIHACAAALNEAVSIRQGDFVQAVEGAREGDVVYFDPPYVPVNATSDFTSYTSDKFGMNDQCRLAALFRQLADRGVAVMLSNSDTPAVRALYAGWEMIEVRMKRHINSKGTGRGAVGELIVVSRRDARTEHYVEGAMAGASTMTAEIDEVDEQVAAASLERPEHSGTCTDPT